MNGSLGEELKMVKCQQKSCLEGGLKMFEVLFVVDISNRFMVVANRYQHSNVGKQLVHILMVETVEAPSWYLKMPKKCGYLTHEKKLPHF